MRVNVISGIRAVAIAVASNALVASGAAARDDTTLRVGVLAELSNDVLVLDLGREVVQGAPAAVIGHPEVVQAYPWHAGRHPG